MRRLLFSLTVLFTWYIAMAVPAKPGFMTYTQSDGTQITVQLMGDEFFHYFVTRDGLPIDQVDNGDFHYVTTAGASAVMAHDQSVRTADELSFIAQNTNKLTAIETPQHKAHRAAATLRRLGQTQVPTIGSPRVPILLVQYTDKEMANSLEQFEAHYKTSAKSVLQYFTDQSNGLYTPQYDIYGIYSLPSSRATYGANTSNGRDQGVALMVCDAIDTAGDEIDWSLYDNDGDGEADVCIVVYAGPGESQGASRNTIWPCQWSLSAGAYYGDGTGARNRNGVTIDRFAVFNETFGNSDYNTTMDGIGTFCHEFSHCLGLPDFYCTTYTSGRYGMGRWSLMHSGCYNGDAIDGDTPIGYSAYEKNFMHWIDYIEPISNTQYTLPVFNAKNAETDQAIKIVSDLNKNEYFILENRRKQGWDQYIADEGVLITHFTYVPNRWETNTVNNEVVQLATIIPADNIASVATEVNDLYGQSNHEFTPTSTPAMVLNLCANDTLASSTGDAGTLDKPITDIVLNEDGSASLWYDKTEFHVSPEQLVLRIPKGKVRTATFEVTGKRLSHNVELTLIDENDVFAIDKTSLTPTQLAEGDTVTVTFAPQEIGNYAATVKLVCDGLDTLTIMLSGEGLIESENPVMLPVDSTQVTETSFRADWIDLSPAENVNNYILYIDKIKPQLLEEADFSSLTEQVESYMWWSSLRNVASEASNFLPQDWTCGSTLFVTNGAIIAASNLTTRTYELPEGYDKVSVVVKAKSFNESQYGTSTLQLRTNGNHQSSQVSTSSNEAEYALVAEANAIEILTLMTSNNPQISSIKVYAGDINVQADAPLIAAVEAGAEYSRVIEGITNNYYVVENLRAGGSYIYKVEAVYVNGTRSDMSNIETVTLLQPVTGLRGDANGDGKVDISDVNAVINMMLGKADKVDNCNMNGDGKIDISDVNAVINKMLGKD